MWCVKQHSKTALLYQTYVKYIIIPVSSLLNCYSSEPLLYESNLDVLNINEPLECQHNLDVLNINEPLEFQHNLDVLNINEPLECQHNLDVLNINEPLYKLVTKEMNT